MKTILRPLALVAVSFVTLAVGSADASVRVYGEASSTGPEISVRVFADITSPAVVSHSFRLFYPSRQLQVTGAQRNEGIWFFHDGTRSVPQSAPDTATPGEVLFISGHMDGRAPRTGVTGNHVLLGTVLFRRLGSDAPNFDLSIGRAGQFASFVTVDGGVLEAQPGQVILQSITPEAGDQDLDGLSDSWEEKYFGSTKEAFYSDDADRDGVNNRGEETMGSDPTDPRSLLRLTVTEGRERLVLEWPSAEKRLYTIEASKDLNRFEPIQEDIAATPPRNTFELNRSELGEVLFFRVRVATGK